MDSKLSILSISSNNKCPDKYSFKSIVVVLFINMSYLLNKLCSKQEVDDVIRLTEDLVLVLRFGRDSDLTCIQLDEIVS